MRERHPLTFAQLRAASLERDRYAFGHCMHDWTPADWATATAGELGEAFNLLAHARRGEPIERAAIAAELADVVIYLDLLAARLGIDLGRAVAWKFNVTSQRRGAPDRLAPAPDIPAEPGTRLQPDYIEDEAATELRRIEAFKQRQGVVHGSAAKPLPPWLRLGESGAVVMALPDPIPVGSSVAVSLYARKDDPTRDWWAAETLWLRVIEATAGQYVGTLESPPNSTSELDYGTPIQFQRSNVERWKAATATPPRQP